MAYNDNEFQIIIEGVIGTYEVWSNTWTFLDVAETNPRADAVANVRTFYQGIAGQLNNNWAANTCTVRELETGLGIPATWETLVGTVAGSLMPTQLAIRVSLDDQNGHRGGPFLCGFHEGVNDSTGDLSATAQAAILGAIDQLASDSVTDGYQLRIDRPTVATTVPAVQARVGERWDVIRRRANNVPEAFAAAILV